MNIKTTFIFATLAFALPITAMETKPWWQRLYANTKKIVQTNPIYPKQFPQNTYLNILDFCWYRKIEQIIKKGSSVKKVETQRLRDAHNEILKNYKQCAEMSDEEWDVFKRLFDTHRRANPLFKASSRSENMLTYARWFKNQNNNNKSLEEQNFEAKVKIKIFEKLKKRNLNPAAVIIDFDNEEVAAAEQQFDTDLCNRYTIKNSIKLGKAIQHYNNDELSPALDHEITHLEQNHGIEKLLLIGGNSFEFDDPRLPCSIPFWHHREFEADILYSLSDINTAKAQAISLCSITRHDATLTHPSSMDRCDASYRIFRMLEIEQELRKKQYENRTQESYIKKMLLCKNL